jgi:hypothetical protein
MLLRNSIRPPVQSGTHHADTPKQTRFFYALNHLNKLGGVPLTKLIKDQDISRTTAYQYLRERKAFGNIMERRHLGRQERVKTSTHQGQGGLKRSPLPALSGAPIRQEIQNFEAFNSATES